MAFHGAVFAGLGPNGAGSDVRDPMYFEKTDKVYLGTWECTSDPHSTLTIKEANPQTGGYYVDFFFYRLAHADGYANISGDKLSINQGSVNDDQDFKGIFEKTQTGIRFTVTESGFNYLKPGETFEYKKMSGKPAVADTEILGKWTQVIIKSNMKEITIRFSNYMRRMESFTRMLPLNRTTVGKYCL